MVDNHLYARLIENVAVAFVEYEGQDSDLDAFAEIEKHLPEEPQMLDVVVDQVQLANYHWQDDVENYQVVDFVQEEGRNWAAESQVLDHQRMVVEVHMTDLEIQQEVHPA